MISMMHIDSRDLDRLRLVAFRSVSFVPRRPKHMHGPSHPPGSNDPTHSHLLQRPVVIDL